MSFFSTKSESKPVPTSEEMDPSRREMMIQAKMEVDGLSNLFKGMSLTCFNKCVNKGHHSDTLSVAELTCIDRCAVKYIDTQTTIGKQLAEWQQQAVQERAGMIQQLAGR